MTAITITVEGVERIISDIGIYRTDLANVERELVAIYADFDPEQTDRLLPREEEIASLYNRRLDLIAIVERWDDAERASANILAAWTVVEEIRKGDAS